jgi:hypothetical protein
MCKCGGACSTNNADGILGTGICLSSACRNRMNESAEAEAALKKAQADAIAKINSGGASSSNAGLIIAVVAVTVIIVVVASILLLRKKK